MVLIGDRMYCIVSYIARPAETNAIMNNEITAVKFTQIKRRARIQTEKKKSMVYK